LRREREGMKKGFTWMAVIVMGCFLAGCGRQQTPDLQALEEHLEAMEYPATADDRSFFVECEELEKPDSAIEGVILESEENGRYCYVLGLEEESAQTALRDYKVVLLLADYRVEDVSGEGTAFSVKKDGKSVAECAVNAGERGYGLTLSFLSQ